jgi:hypothetical protein
MVHGANEFSDFQNELDDYRRRLNNSQDGVL